MSHHGIKMITLIAAGLTCITAIAQTHSAAAKGLHLSDGVRQLLRAEMQEITRASRDLVTAQVTGDWQTVADLGEHINDSYVMKQRLTESQKSELHEKLPPDFKRLDMEFHARAAKLASAAEAKDAEWVAFHYSRMLETCAACHATYAGERFPGFAAPETEAGHQH